MRDIKHW